MKVQLCAGLALTSLAAFAWDMGEPIVTYWAGPGYEGSGVPITEQTVRQLKEGGFNVLWTTSKEELDLAAKGGMRGLFALPHVRGRRFNDAERARLVKVIASIKDHPALCFYRQVDEPPADWFECLGEDRDFVRALDPKHPCLVNLLPTYANNKQLGIPGEIISAYWEHVRRFMDVYDPEFVSYDHYQFNNGWDTGDYFLNLAVVQKHAAERGIPFMNGVQACTWVPGSAASPGSPRIPGSDEMRFLVYTTLAYGAQGIYYYVYTHPGHRGSIVAQDGTPDEKYYTLKKLNPIFVATAKQLRGYALTGAFFRGFCPRGGTPYGRRALLSFRDDVRTVNLPNRASFTNTTLVTRFDASGRKTRLMVVNLDYRQNRTLDVVAPAAVSRFDPATGEWMRLGETFALVLGKGEGVLLELDDIAANVSFSRSSIIAHRGDWEQAPENSIAAFRAALDRGFGVELDLYVLKDGRVVATHNPPVAGKENTYPEIGQILDLVRPGTRFILDLKGGGTDEALIGPIKREMAKRPAVTPETVTFFGGAGWIRANMPEYKSGHVHIVRKGWKRSDPPLDNLAGEVDRAARGNMGLWAPRWDDELVTAGLVRRAHEKGLKVAVWTVNDAPTALEALRRGVDYVMSDRANSLYDDMVRICAAGRSR